MDKTVDRIVSKLYDYKPTADEVSRADELRTMADALANTSDALARSGDFGRGYETACSSAAEMLRDRADAILAGGA